MDVMVAGISLMLVLGIFAFLASILCSAAFLHNSKVVALDQSSPNTHQDRTCSGFHVFGWSDFVGVDPGGRVDHGAEEIRMLVPVDLPQNGRTKGIEIPEGEDYGRVEDFNLGTGRVSNEEEG